MKYNLRHSIPILLFLFLCISAVIHLWYMISNGHELALRAAQSQAELRGKEMANLMQHMLERDDKLGIQKEISWAASDTSLETILFISDTDNILFALDYRFTDRNVREVIDDQSYGVIKDVRTRGGHASRVDADAHRLWNAFPIDLPPRPGELRSLRSGVLFLEHDYSRTAQMELARGFREFYGFMVFLVVFCVGIWLVLRVFLVERVEEIVDATRRFAAGNLSARSLVSGDDELAQTGRAFNEMAERIEAATAGIIKKGEERFELALRGADLGMWDWEIKTGAMFFSQRWIEMLGYAREELQPHIAAWENLIHPDDRAEVVQGMNRCYEGTDTTYQGEYRMQNKVGKWVWVYVSGRVMEWDQEKKPLRMLGTTLDITERKAWEKARENMIAKLQEALCNVKTLKGLVPVCAWCHKVRDDQGYWQELTAFIHEHTEADISHGICPECANKERAEFTKKSDAKVDPS
ncbi:MAG: PAS domain-containing protein [Nitrospirota bacterium]|nr:PAS domain-containing protein [Nitrospirota bacterium]